MDKKIKALFFDIDGTLVSFKTHRIPQSTVDALEQAKKNGVEVYISTGRPKQIINNLGQIDHLIDGYITANGARCFVEDALVSQHAILPSDVRKIIEAADTDNYPATKKPLTAKSALNLEVLRDASRRQYRSRLCIA